jgi:hypothetical protein
MGRSGRLLAGGAGVFAVIWGSLVGRCGYAPGCRVGVGLLSGAGSSSMDLGTGFHLLGIFVGRFCRRGWFILSAGLLPWVDGWFCGFSGGFVGIFARGH